MPKSNYALCDFCHKAKPIRELERITVVYRKCKDCVPDQLRGSEAREAEGVVKVKPLKVNLPVQPPAYLREAFIPPSELEPKTPPISKKEDVKSTTKSTTV